MTAERLVGPILQINEAVGLVTAWADRFAQDLGVRTLVIKGETLERQGLRDHHASVDVDLWVDPSRFDEFVGALGSMGWHAPIGQSAEPDPDSKHSATVYHEMWPITIDVHHRFPGFLADPQTVFDALWERRTSTTIAAIEVAAPDAVGHTAIAALHYLRRPDGGLAMGSLPGLEQRVPHVLGRDGLAELSSLAGRVGAATTLADFLTSVGAPPATDHVDAEALRAWEVRTRAPLSTSWVVSIAEQPFWAWPRAVWRATMLPDADIAQHHVLPGESIRQARWRRIRRGLARVPGALGYLVRRRLRAARGRRNP